MRRIALLLAASFAAIGLTATPAGAAPTAPSQGSPGIAACSQGPRFTWAPTAYFNPGDCTQTAGSMFIMQGDGNLVLYYSYGFTCATNTAGANGAVAVFQDDGNLVIYYFGYPIWHSGTNGNYGARLIHRGDGTLLIRNAAGAEIWRLC